MVVILLLGFFNHRSETDDKCFNHRKPVEAAERAAQVGRVAEPRAATDHAVRMFPHNLVGVIGLSTGRKPQLRLRPSGTVLLR